MMHCTMEDLGALQAGEASVWARRHITTCAACQAELEGLYQRISSRPCRRCARRVTAGPP